jgi:hypothetical protein
MTSAIGTAAAPFSGPRRWGWTLVTAIVASAAVATVAVTNQPYFELLNGWIGADDAITRARCTRATCCSSAWPWSSVLRRDSPSG